MIICIVYVLAMYCIVGYKQSYSVNDKMNNLYDLYLAYKGKRNIFQEVKGFQKQGYQPRNFQAVMKRLKNTVELSNLVYKTK